MPRIYELPASAGPSSESLVIKHTPGTIPESFRRQPQSQSGSANPRQMMANQMDMELNSITQQFDSQVFIIDQQQLEPDKYKTEYAKLQRQAMNQRIAIQAKHQKNAQQIKNIQKLVEIGMLTPEQMQSTMLVMAGVPIKHVQRAFAQIQRMKPSTRLNELESENQSIQKWQEKFEDYRGKHFWRGKEREKLYVIDRITGKKRLTSEIETEAYDASISRQIEISRSRGEIYSRLTPLEQYAQAGSRAVQRFGMGRKPMPTGRWGSVQIPEPAPVRPKQLTKELAITILKEAGGDKTRARQIAKKRGYKL